MMEREADDIRNRPPGLEELEAFIVRAAFFLMMQAVANTLLVFAAVYHGYSPFRRSLLRLGLIFAEYLTILAVGGAWWGN